MKALKLTLLNLREILVSLDQLLNVLLSTVCMRHAYSDETLSAHAWRAYAAGKWFGRLLMPPIDAMFFWQKPDPAYLDEHGKPITSHCRRAFEKERAKQYLPPQYRA